jgi:ComF family protein
MGGVNVKNTMIEVVLTKVAPHLCFGCGKTGTTLCYNCKYNITSEPFSGCFLCGKPSSDGLCAHHDVPICKAWIVSERREVLQQAIDAYKFQFTKAAVHTLAGILDESLPMLPRDMVIVPIPTASSHVRQRGYDHLELLARSFAVKREMPVSRLLLRTSSKTQHELNKKDRQHEAIKAFALTTAITVPLTTPILLLDDIVTTGSTLVSAAKALSSAGYENIFSAALAYQPLD